MVTPGAGRRDGQRQGALRNARDPACTEGELGTPSMYGIFKRKHMLAARLRYHPGNGCFHHGNQHSYWKTSFILKTSFMED